MEMEVQWNDKHPISVISIKGGRGVALRKRYRDTSTIYLAFYYYKTSNIKMC